MEINEKELEIILEMYEWVCCEGQETIDMENLIEKIRKEKNNVTSL